MEKNRVKNLSTCANLKMSLHTSSLVCLKILAQKNFGNSSKADLKFFRPIGRNANAKFKGAPNFFRGGNSKFAPTRFCVLSPSRRVLNFRPIGAETEEQYSFFEIAIAPHTNAMRARYKDRCQKSRTESV